jgi:hypothetical protein
MKTKTKKLFAAILAAALTLSSASAAFAANSPTPSSELPKAGTQKVESNKQDTTQVKVSKNGKDVAASKVKDTATATVGGKVNLENKDGSRGDYPVNALATKAVKDNKKTKTLKTTKTVTTIKKNALQDSNVKKMVSTVTGTLTLKKNALANSKLKTFTAKGKGKLVLGSGAFKNSPVVKVNVNTKAVTFKKNSGKGIKSDARTVINIKNISSAKKVTVAKGAFGSNSIYMKVVVNSKSMSKKEFDKVKTKFEKGGFKGTIILK